MDSEQLLDVVAARLRRRFPQLASDDLRRAAMKAYEPLVDARVRLYLPMLVERRAIDELAGRMDSDLSQGIRREVAGEESDSGASVEIIPGESPLTRFPATRVANREVARA